MDLTQKAIIRKQIEELIMMKRELVRDLSIVKKSLSKIDEAFQKRLTSADRKFLEEHKKCYKENQKELERTIKTADDIIKDLRDQSKPSSYMKI